MKYEPLPTFCNCSKTAIEWALDKLRKLHGIKLVYTLYVSNSEFLYVRHTVQELNGWLPPQINLEVDPEIPGEGWYLSDGISAVGSPGVS